jgi:adenylate cyclase
VGHLSEITAIFADCRDFTRLTREMGPEVITPFIDEFFRRCGDIVVSHDGILDNFRGDAVLAFFNVPIRNENHVAAGVEAAVQIQAAVPEINARLGSEDVLGVGIGVTTGMAYASLVGSDDCKDYTVMGDVVNMGSRLQNLAGRGEILASESVHERVADAFPDASESTVEIKGASDPVNVYRLLTSESPAQTSS